MRILLTNDDGIKSPGLDALRQSLNMHDVWVVAPKTEQSGKSHSVTLFEPVCYEQLDEQVFSCSGSPADCVLYSYRGALPVKPDIVISGINIGPNLGTDLIYSGTAAAARQAALMGYPGVAVSMSSFAAPFHFGTTADFIADNLELLLELWHLDHFININTPNVPEFTEGVRITGLSRRMYSDEVVRFDAPRGGTYFFLEGGLIANTEDGTDSECVASGAISVSPVFLHPQNRLEEKIYHDAEFKLR
ncbi:MAG: 5'/3'-nucleotidase SurE [Spirochaetales bacterium]|nr:5'/3'-nucleotidase SurE [Spirochaetales bacterium]